MEVKNVALAAVKMLTYTEDELKLGNTTVAQTLLLGYFKGVAAGNITVGQDWPVKILVDNQTLSSKIDCTLLEQAVLSGMLCFGQTLSNRNLKSHRRITKPSDSGHER